MQVVELSTTLPLSKFLLFDKDLKIKIYYNIKSFMVNTTTNVVLKVHLMINITTLVVHLVLYNTNERVTHTEAIGPRLTTGNLSCPPLRTWLWVVKPVVPAKVYTPAKLLYYVDITYYKKNFKCSIYAAL